jgi:hypothetical protein
MTTAQYLGLFDITVAQARAFMLNNAGNVENIYKTATKYGVTNEMLAEIYGSVDGLEQFLLGTATTASQHLASYNVSMDEARTFIVNNIDNVGKIYNTAKQYGVTNEMLAEIYGHVEADTVQSFFLNHGFDSSLLDGKIETATSQFLSDKMSGLAPLVSLDSYTGDLSVESLRAKVIAATNNTDYYALFDAKLYKGSADGIFTPNETGFTQLGNLMADSKTIESLFYGTFIKTLKAIDLTELIEIQNFVKTNQTAITADNADVLNQYQNLIISIYNDQATPPIFNDTAIVNTIVQSAVDMIHIVGSGGAIPSLFEGMTIGYAG